MSISRPAGNAPPAEAIVLFLKPRMSDAERRAVDDFFARARQWRPAVIAIVSSFRVDLGDDIARQIEADAIEQAKGCGGRVAVFRTGAIVNDRLARLAPFYPLVPRRMCGCFLHKEELLAAIESDALPKGRGRRASSPCSGRTDRGGRCWRSGAAADSSPVA